MILVRTPEEGHPRACWRIALAAERLLSRDGLSFSEAVTLLTQRDPQYFSLGELEAVYLRLPLRKPPLVFLSDENVLAELPSEDSAEERVRAGEREIALRSAAAALDRAMGNCGPEDRLLLQLRFSYGRTVPEIARILHQSTSRR